MALDPLSAGLDLVNTVVNRIWPNATDQVKAKAALKQLEVSGELKQLAVQAGLSEAQIETNKTEAASTNLFVAGWRPWIGWTCGAAFAWAYVLQPITQFILAAAGNTMLLPTLNLTAMMPVLLGMLGLGGMRSFEKLKNVNQRHQ